mmetsp:Transcript_21899/g.38757  ORF Transcript_21899/g.38757 Transcript_21899/m.38757 type:complete len:282 (-) Transcript_21899:157-1002(-)|eukprot:CAMPEP_0115100586 /NCGR_PEP_ID=MMETSP0227-20121206/32670_1 /TAXON_ID=89957 /ORGANISM="Polarella glacialis, Strain CCMP 1383" /LENGTH=281 /DNA_ID=CAMNT_0002496065 /DNA_START=79 /DNA_END=924 /DNA_ORIENTATION=+
MGPVKFDDISKVTTEVLNDDYQGAGYQLRAKQKTSWDASVVSTTVDLWPGKDCQTPAKVGWKFPSPFGIKGVCVDKLEMDKAGKFKMEVSADKGLHSVADLKLETKSDLVDPSKATAACIYTGVKDTMVKLETKPMNPADFNLEVTRSIDIATVGLRFGMANLTAPDIAARIESGPLFAALLAKEKFGVFSASCCFKANDDLKVAASYEHGGKKSGSCSLGVAYTGYTGIKGAVYKAKVEQDMSTTHYIKYEVAKGFVVSKTFKYETQSGNMKVGVTLSVE